LDYRLWRLHIWHSIGGFQDLDLGSGAEAVFGQEETSAIGVEVDVSAWIAAADGVEEDGPAKWAAFDLDVRCGHFIVIVRAEHNSYAFGFVNEDRDVGRAVFGQLAGCDFSGKVAGIVGGDVEFELPH